MKNDLHFDIYPKWFQVIGIVAQNIDYMQYNIKTIELKPDEISGRLESALSFFRSFIFGNSSRALIGFSLFQGSFHVVNRNGSRIIINPVDLL